MDEAKCQTLKDKLSAQPEPQIVAIAEFFDGNDDPGSIGCNLTRHPGIGTFRDVLTGLLRRANVQAVYSRISEVDPGEEIWPFSDTILVVGTISGSELRKAVRSLQPDDVAEEEAFGVPPMADSRGSSVTAIWWD